jgi:hypothetical protein
VTEEGEAERALTIAVLLVQAHANDERTRRRVEEAAVAAAFDAARLFARIDVTTTPEEEDS